MSAGAAAVLAIFAAAGADAGARDREIAVQVADPNEQGDGTMGAAAARAMARGALARSAGETAAKDALSRAARAAADGGDPTAAQLAPAGAARGPLAPVIPGGHHFEGQLDTGSSPPDTTGAIGRTRYIQLVNRRFGIYNRTTNALIDSGTLNQLAGLAASVNTFDPQIIWDPQTNRFYYVNDSIFSATDNRLSFGFSKTASPNSEADFCHYTFAYGSEFPDYPKLGDSGYFLIIGVNTFAPSFVGSDIVAISKPPAGSACPAGSTFKTGIKFTLRDTANQQVFTPVPSQDVDTRTTGYVMARNGGLPSNSLWFYNVVRNAAGNPVFGNARRLVVPNYTLPPNAPAGIGTSRLLDTLDARPTQAILAINPDRGASAYSFWTQHTIRHATQNRAVVRWYEINPVPGVPTLLRSGEIGNATPNTFFFNAAISPDRRVETSTRQFGDNFVIGYSVTRGGASGINPRIVMGSSVNGGGLTFTNVRNSTGDYLDFTCAGATQTCRWGDYAAATPDPRPGTNDRGVVWLTNQYASGGNSTAQANWRTRIWAARP
jgi:hypothetical protein